MIGCITSGLFGAPLPPVVVTGGTLYTSGGYNYRVFTGNGTLGVSGGTLSCDILIVAGGGGGGRIVAGGGGAGGLVYLASQSISTNQSVTIGAGGAGSTTSGYTSGAQGGNTTIGSFTAAGGATTASLALSNISSSASQPVPVLAMMNIQ